MDLSAKGKKLFTRKLSVDTPFVVLGSKLCVRLIMLHACGEVAKSNTNTQPIYPVLLPHALQRSISKASLKAPRKLRPKSIPHSHSLPTIPSEQPDTAVSLTFDSEFSTSLTPSPSLPPSPTQDRKHLNPFLVSTSSRRASFESDLDAPSPRSANFDSEWDFVDSHGKEEEKERRERLAGNNPFEDPSEVEDQFGQVRMMGSTSHLMKTTRRGRPFAKVSWRRPCSFL